MVEVVQQGTVTADWSHAVPKQKAGICLAQIAAAWR